MNKTHTGSKALPSERQAAGRKRLDSLTGLRALAAFGVFIYHFNPPVPEGYAAFAHEHLFRPGVSGVSFFFMLSGLVLAWSHKRDVKSVDFFRRRIARVYPAYFAVTLIGLALLSWQNKAWPAPEVIASVLTLVQAWTGNPDWYFVINGVQWSMSVEAFFYLLFPLLIVGITRLSNTSIWIVAAVSAVASIAISTYFNFHPTQAMQEETFNLFGYPPYRTLEFAIGTCLGVLLSRGIRSPVPFRLSMVVLLAAFLGAGSLPGPMITCATLLAFALVLLSAATADLNGIKTLFSTRVLSVLGTWSYAFYLLHALVIGVAPSLNGDRLSYAPLWLATLAVSILAAGLMYVAVERPFEKVIRGRPRAKAQN